MVSLMAAFRLAGLSLIATTGIAGLSADARPILHAAFGALLLSMVLVSFRKVISGDRLDEAAARVLSRRLSRTVYLMLYLIFGANLIMRAGWSPAVPPPENLREYFSYGLVALVAIRVLAVLSVRRPPAPRMNPQLAPAGDAAARQ
jgi:hypothetical protein